MIILFVMLGNYFRQKDPHKTDCDNPQNRKGDTTHLLYKNFIDSLIAVAGGYLFYHLLYYLFIISYIQLIHHKYQKKK